jgi:putative hydrolase of HD superfamily
MKGVKMTAADKTRFATIAGYYVMMNRLKNLIRAGWKLHDISAERLESVAEHVFGTQMLAIAYVSEMKVPVDLPKVILMLAVHEVGETVIGDITPWDGITKDEKSRAELAAVKQVFSKLAISDELTKLFMEFEENKTKEAIFCKQIDKLEADLQIKLYDESGRADYTKKNKNPRLEARRQYHLKKGNSTLSKAWINNEIEEGIYSGDFLDFAKFIIENDIKEQK